MTTAVTVTLAMASAVSTSTMKASPSYATGIVETGVGTGIETDTVITGITTATITTVETITVGITTDTMMGITRRLTGRGGTMAGGRARVTVTGPARSRATVQMDITGTTVTVQKKSDREGAAI